MSDPNAVSDDQIPGMAETAEFFQSMNRNFSLMDARVEGGTLNPRDSQSESIGPTSQAITGTPNEGQSSTTIGVVALKRAAYIEEWLAFSAVGDCEEECLFVEEVGEWKGNTGTASKELVRVCDRPALCAAQDSLGPSTGFAVPDDVIASLTSNLKYKKLSTIKTYFKNRAKRLTKAVKLTAAVEGALDLNCDFGNRIAVEVLAADVRGDGIASTLDILYPKGAGAKIHAAPYTKDGLCAVSAFQKAYADEIVRSHFENPRHQGKSKAAVRARILDAQTLFVQLLNYLAQERERILGPVLSSGGVTDKRIWRLVGQNLMQPVNDGFVRVLQRESVKQYFRHKPEA